MSVRMLAWYVSGLLGVTWVLLSLISVVPDDESERAVARGTSIVGVVLFAAVGLSCGCLSAQHWVNRSRIWRSMLLALAIGLTGFLLVGIIG